jgi:hypothetical protein
MATPIRSCSCLLLYCTTTMFVVSTSEKYILDAKIIMRVGRSHVINEYKSFSPLLSNTNIKQVLMTAFKIDAGINLVCVYLQNFSCSSIFINSRFAWLINFLLLPMMLV